MYQCQDCRAVFESPEIYKQQSEEHGKPAFETFYGCPYCYSGDYDKGDECVRCGKFHNYVDLSEGLCQKCVAANYKTETMINYITSDDLISDVLEYLLDIDGIEAALKEYCLGTEHWKYLAKIV